MEINNVIGIKLTSSENIIAIVVDERDYLSLYQPLIIKQNGLILEPLVPIRVCNYDQPIVVSYVNVVYTFTINERILKEYIGSIQRLLGKGESLKKMENVH